ncbi:MAG: hypothetical protein KKA52_00750 [Candidatus Omnitrophica bacterium]|nr:hypothetical protein [Candidatus Omnitrophota bacterium]
MKRLIYLVVSAIFLLVQLEVFAAPVNLPQGVKGKEGVFLNEKIAGVVDVSGSVLYDNFSRKIKSGGDSGKIDANFYGGQVGLTFSDRFDFYALFGGLSDAELKNSDLGSDVTFEFEDKLMWGLGLSAIIHEWEDSGIQIFGDGNYRQSRNISVDAIVIDGVRYTKDQFTPGSSIEAKWDEWQVALGISKKFDYFIPYVGVKYSDIKTSAKATVSGTSYQSDAAKSKGKVGPFIGVSILPMKGVSIDLGGRFVDETAFSAKATIRF